MYKIEKFLDDKCNSLFSDADCCKLMRLCGKQPWTMTPGTPDTFDCCWSCCCCWLAVEVMVLSETLLCWYTICWELALRELVSCARLRKSTDPSTDMPGEHSCCCCCWWWCWWSIDPCLTSCGECWCTRGETPATSEEGPSEFMIGENGVRWKWCEVKRRYKRKLLIS